MLTFEQKQTLMELLPDFHLMAEPQYAAALKGIGVVDAATPDEILAAHELGLNRREIFYAAPSKERMGEILDKCRIVANSMEELIAINEAAAAFAQGGHLIMVGLRLAAEDFPGKPALGMTTDELRQIVHDIKQLKNISVCGCIVEADLTGLHGKALGKFVRATYRTAKSMTCPSERFTLHNNPHRKRWYSAYPPRWPPGGIPGRSRGAPPDSLP